MRVRAAKIGASLAIAWGLAANPASAHPAWGIAVDPQGRVVFSEVTSNTVWRIESDGKAVPIVQGKHSHDISIDPHGGISVEHVVYDARHGRWITSKWTLDPAGRLSEAEGSGLSGDGTTKARGPDGSRYLTEGATVRRIAPDGTTTTLGGDPFGGISHGEHPRLLGLAVRPGGSVLVADYDHHIVREIAPDGRVSELWRSGPLWSPSGVAVAGDSVYLLEARPETVSIFLEALGPWVRVRRIGPDGSAVTLAEVGGSRWGAVVGVLALVAALGFFLRFRRR